MTRDEIRSWLAESSPDRLKTLFGQADRVRADHVGTDVHLRGLIELSNHCRRGCTYCGLSSAAASAPTRYRLTADEILTAAESADRLGYGTVVLQAGEDPQLTGEFIGNIIRTIKDRWGLAVTLSLGERSDQELVAWRDAGADRYLLRFETSDRQLLDRIHPPLPDRPGDRLALLRRLRQIGYEIGSGMLIGIPGQTLDSLARDVELLAELELDMIGVGPFVPHPATPLGRQLAHAGHEQEVRPDTETTAKVLALGRLLCPAAHIPATSALATIDPAGGRLLGLARGADVIMPNLTPAPYRRYYEIYPAKASADATIEQTHRDILAAIAAAGRTVGTGRGDSPHYLARTDTTATPTDRLDASAPRGAT
jgi:biotin synthase